MNDGLWIANWTQTGIILTDVFYSYFLLIYLFRKLRRQLATPELRRAARKPWRPLIPQKAAVI